MTSSLEKEVLAHALVEAVTKLSWYGEETPIYLDAPAGAELVTMDELFAPENLRGYLHRAIRAWTAQPEIENQRAAASRFMRRYTGSVIVAAMVPLAHGLGVDVAPSRMRFLMRQDMPMGTVLDVNGMKLRTAIDRPSLWPVTAEPVATVSQLRDAVLGTMFGDNIGPAIDQVLELVPMSPTVLWASVAEGVDLAWEKAADSYDPAPLAALREDRDLILFSATLPGIDGPNPMVGTLEWETFDHPELPKPMQVRTVCCLCYLVPGRNYTCRSCGRLDHDQRLELWLASEHR